MRMFGTRLNGETRRLLEALARRRRCPPATMARELLSEALHQAVAAAGGPSRPRWLLARAIRNAEALPLGAARRVLLRAIARYVHTLERRPAPPDAEDRRLLEALHTIFADALDRHHVQAAIRDLTAPAAVKE